MRVLRESLLLVVVVGLVLYLYFLAAGAAVLTLCGFISDREERPVHDLKMAAT